MVGNDFDKQLGVLLGKLREEKGWSQDQLRENAGVERRETITQWENGTRKVKAEHIVQLCKAFGISADYLLGLSDDPQRTPSAVDELGLAPGAVKHLKDVKRFADDEQDLDGDFHRRLSALNSILSDKRFARFLTFFTLAEKAAEKTRAANKLFEEAKGNRLPAGPVSLQDRDSYSYTKYLCLKQFEKMLDAFCKAEGLDE